MFSRQLRGVAMAASTALVLLSAPAPSYALFDWLCPANWFNQRTANTSYTPPFSGQMTGFAPRYNAPPWRPMVAAAPAGLGPTAMTCSYVPVTCYRTEYRLTPATECQAVAYYEPCSGSPMVTYRPATTWAYRPQLVPYNTYRIVYSAPAVTCAPAARCATYGTVMPSSVSAPGCTSCGRTAGTSSMISPIPSSATTVMPAPSLPGPVPSMSQPPIGGTWPGPTSYGRPSSSVGLPPSGAGPSAMPSAGPVSSPGRSSAPSSSSTLPSTAPGPVAPGSNPGPTKTFDNGTSPATQERLKPTPDSNTGPAPAKMPSLGAPQGRTAQRPIRQAVYVQPVSYTQAGSPVPPRLDTSGWEAAGN